MKNKNKLRITLDKRILLIVSMFMLVSLTLGVSALDKGTFSNQGAEYFDNGYVINILIDEDYEINGNITVYFTPYTLSGKTINFNDIECRFGLISDKGKRLFLINNTDMNGIDDIWYFDIDGNFINETGEYLYNLDCQGATFGGYKNGELKIEPNDDKQFILNLENKISMFLFILLIALSTIFLFTELKFLSGYGYAIGGLMLMFSQTNFIISFLIFLVGFSMILLFRKK